MSTLYRGKHYDIKDGIRYGNALYYAVVRSDGKGVDTLHLDLEKAKERWRKLEVEKNTHRS